MTRRKCEAVTPDLDIPAFKKVCTSTVMQENVKSAVESHKACMAEPRINLSLDQSDVSAAVDWDTVREDKETGQAVACLDEGNTYAHQQQGGLILPCSTGHLLDYYILKEDELGRGQYGIVRSCIHRQTGAMLACKTVNKGALQKKQQVEALRTEIAVMAYLAGHPNIVEQVAVYEDVESVHVVMELCRGGDLFDLIKQAKRLREVDAGWFFRKVVAAVSHCHSLGLVHRDLKPENILVGMDGSVEPKLADFGLAAVLPHGRQLQGLAGSPSYMAPEIIWGEPYGSPADIWSLGVILYFMLSGYLPFHGKNPIMTFAAVCRGEIDLVSPPWTLVSTSVKNLLLLMLNRDPTKRPTAAQVLKHPWMMSFGPLAPPKSTQFGNSVPSSKQPFLIPALPGHEILESDFLSLATPCSSQPLPTKEWQGAIPEFDEDLQENQRAELSALATFLGTFPSPQANDDTHLTGGLTAAAFPLEQGGLNKTTQLPVMKEHQFMPQLQSSYQVQGSQAKLYRDDFVKSNSPSSSGVSGITYVQTPLNFSANLTRSKQDALPPFQL